MEDKILNTPAGDESPLLYRRLGELVRSLHEALSELGYDKRIESAMTSLPDARSGLSYISRLTGDAAEKVLNAVDHAKADQDALADAARTLAAAPAAAPAGVAAFVDQVKQTCARTDEHLTAIMMAQDFHDLTGQVTRRLIETVQRLEHDLLLLLVEAAPANQRATPEPKDLAGPVTDPSLRTDVVENQQQVDDLLESLGF